MGIIGMGTLEAQNQDPAEASELSIKRLGDDSVVIEFDGILQRSTALDGSWTDVPGAQSPYTVTAEGELALFRIRREADIFADSAPAAFTLTGPFQRHFDLAFAGLPDGIFPPVREKPYFEASLTLDDRTLPVRIRVRGNSSLQECPFPKLKVKISRSNRAGTPFAHAREIKIGTHCAEGGMGTIGRLREEKAAYREVLIYEAMDRLGFTGPRTRRALIEYVDPTGDADHWPVKRMAFIFEHVEVLAENMNGRALEDEEVAQLTDAGFDEQLTLELKLFHALVGNWDYALSVSGEGLWNTEVIRLDDASLLPVAGDFDLAAWVTGAVLVSAPRDYLPQLDDVPREINYRLGEIAAEHGAARFEIARNRFLAAQAQIEQLILAADVDDEGRSFAGDYTSNFFEILARAKPLR